MASFKLDMLVWITMAILLFKFISAEDPLAHKLLSINDSYMQLCKKVRKSPVTGTNCKNYLYCILTSTGYKFKEYTCPFGFLFDPIKQSCTNSYICEEIAESTISTEKNTYTTLDTIAEHTTTIQPDTGNNNIPECKESGKFPITGTDCKKYLLCISTSNGFKYKQYQCPSEYNFDPNKSVCTKNYRCSESSSNIPSGTTESSTGSGAQNTKSDTADCTTHGKFSIPGTNCTKYLLCVTTLAGFVSKTYYCPTGYKFDPNAKRCTVSYLCTELSLTTEISTIITNIVENGTNSDAISTTMQSELGTPKCVKAGKFAIDGSQCRRYRLCVSTATGFKSKEYECPRKYYFNPDEERCSNSYTCSELSSTNSDFTTTSVNDVTKENTELSENTNSSPTTDISTETTTKLSNDEISPTTEIDSNSSEGDVISTTVATTKADLSIPKCRQSGRFSVNDTNCRKYILCIYTSSGFISKIYECPSGYYFDPKLKRCTDSYICFDSPTTNSYLTTEPLPTTNKSISTEISTTTSTTITNNITEATSTSAGTTKTEEQAATCKSKGKYPISDTECRKYLLCIPTSNGMISKEYTCPAGFSFDPDLKMCSNIYFCPETTSTTEMSTPTEKNSTSSDLATACPETVKIVEKYPNPFPFSFPSKTARYLNNGKCTTIGRFVVEGTRCKNYILCRANADDTLTGVSYTCPTTTVFNQVIQKCTTRFTCPDNVCFFPSAVPNPNVKDCTSYISCEPNFVNGQIVSYTGRVVNCDPGTYFDPLSQACIFGYVCPNK